MERRLAFVSLSLCLGLTAALSGCATVRPVAAESPPETFRFTLTDDGQMHQRRIGGFDSGSRFVSRAGCSSHSGCTSEGCDNCGESIANAGFARGRPNFMPVGTDWIAGIPGKRIGFHRRTDGHRVSPETEQQLREYLTADRLHPNNQTLFPASGSRFGQSLVRFVGFGDAAAQDAGFAVLATSDSEDAWSASASLSGSSEVPPPAEPPPVVMQELDPQPVETHVNSFDRNWLAEDEMVFGKGTQWIAPSR